MKKRILMIAFEFPPSNGASIQRITSVYKKFLSEGWIVDVLTTTAFSYPKIQLGSEVNLPDNPEGKIIRAFSLDALEQIGFKGKHLGSLINPDRWGMTWFPCALFLGKRHLKKYPADVIWSSAPIPTVHKLGNALSQTSGAKWIADYRDPLPYIHRHGEQHHLDDVHKQIDEMTVKHADVMMFATEPMMRLYQDYWGATQTVVVENGFDEDALAGAKQSLGQYKQSPFQDGVLSFYYAGVLYKDGRDPLPLFEALAQFKQTYPDKPFELIFQGAGDGKEYILSLTSLNIAEDVRFIDGVSIEEALCNMLLSDVLVLIQDAVFNNQVPGKLYEYLATEKTLLLKTPDESSTKKVAEPFNGVFSGQQKESLFERVCDIFNQNKQADSLSGHWVRFPDILRHSRKAQAQIVFNKAVELCDVNGLTG